MSDAPVFAVANFTIHNADSYRLYEKGFFPILKKHGGRFLTYDDNTRTLEGSEPPKGRIVLFLDKMKTLLPRFTGTSSYTVSQCNEQYVNFIKRGLSSKRQNYTYQGYASHPYE